MEYDAKGPLLKVLLLIGDGSSRIGTLTELPRFPDGRLALEHVLETLHSAVPSASTIYLSVYDETQLKGIETVLKDIVARAGAVNKVEHHEHEHDHEHHHPSFPELKPIVDAQEEDIGPAAGLITAHSLYPDAKWLIFACNYPLLPPPALQQLILEYQSPVTCFVNEGGLLEPLIAIWDSEALQMLNENVKNGKFGLDGVVKGVKGRLVKPLREQWITCAKTRKEWDEAMTILASRGE
ncbi:hypothetical protein N431DRAFT_431942 [Stipitochalara longipes BDJ]|nr:hypothetical protein N431DRAFT_431942 [Stipitochalara longipes BDJ]